MQVCDLMSGAGSEAKRQQVVSSPTAATTKSVFAVEPTLEIWRRSARQVRACWPVTALPADLDLDT